MIKVYGLANSRSLRALWALEEAGQEYEFIALDFSKGEQLSEAYLELNPASKVPLLVHGGLVLTESAAIVNYVASEFGKQLIPGNDNRRRAEYDRWCFFVLSELEQGLWTLAKHKFALPSEHRVPEIFATACWEHQRALSVLALGLGDRDYILGSDFSAADILIGHTLLWGLVAKRPLEQENLRRYIERLRQRPGFLAAVKREGSA